MPVGAVVERSPAQEAFGAELATFNALGRQNVTFVVKTAFVRPSKIVVPGYVPMPIAEKDPIQHKYGAFEVIPTFRDPTTGTGCCARAANGHATDMPPIADINSRLPMVIAI